MREKINSILKEVLQENKPTKKELGGIESNLKDFLKRLEERFKKLKINVNIFIGGSFAKKTVIKKKDYDVDIFVRFDKRYADEEISNLTYRALKGFKGVSILHGSRDYFRVNIKPKVFFEIVPVIKIKKPEEARNVTDLSFFHVKYINKKIESEKILDEIILTKKFCYANQFYGAESYIRGFSGYALELLIYHYGSFLKFVNVMAKADKEKKIIIDIEKHYKNKQRIAMDLNSSKLESPIILIDPTYKQRNVLAVLSEETFKRFKKICNGFLRKPGVLAFEVKKLNLEKIKKDAKAKNLEFILIQAKTNKQEGDIAGSKLLKFYKYLTEETGRFFDIKNKGFEYEGGKWAKYFFVVKKKREVLSEGPKVNDGENVKKFREKHKDTFIKKKRVYAKEKIDFNVKKFFNRWRRENRKRIEEMYITELKVF